MQNATNNAVTIANIEIHRGTLDNAISNIETHHIT
jgi:DNA-directed RNA polymerase subunit K/omega